MTAPYWRGDGIELWLGDCREIDAWLTADVLVTDPPYGIGWKRSANPARASAAHAGIQGDADTSSRDAVLAVWGERPAIVFGSFYAPQPADVRQILVYRKPPDAGLVGSTTGFRRDVEPVFLTGPWPRRTTAWSSAIVSNALGVGHLARRHGHPHAKPVDVMETLIAACPPGIIADPFAGSGSTLVAAHNLGRKAIGVEIDERYAERAARRLAQAPLEVL